MTQRLRRAGRWGLVGLIASTCWGPSAPAHAVASVNDAFTVVGHSIQGSRDTGYVTVFEVRNDSQEPATFDATIQLLDASTAVVGQGPGIVDQADVPPGLTGFVHITSTGATVTDARLILDDSHPVTVPAYRDLIVSPPDVTQPDADDLDYAVTVTNLGQRPAAAIVVQAVTRDASGRLQDEMTVPVTDTSPLVPGMARTVTLRRRGQGSAPLGAPMFSALGTETLSVPATGSYDPDTVGGRLSTTWHLATGRRCSARIVRFTDGSPPMTVAHGWTSQRGSVTLQFRLERGFLYTFLIDPSGTCGPYRFNDLALKGAITVQAVLPRTAHRGVRFTVHGTVKGARAGDLVTVQRKSGGPWVTVARGRLRSGGRFTVPMSVTAAGRQTLRVLVPHTTFHFGAASPPCTVLMA